MNNIKQNKYWIFIPSIIFFLIFWYLYAYTKVECICPWNEVGFLYSTIASVVLFIIHFIISYVTIRKKPDKLFYFHFGSLVITLILYIIAMRIFMSYLI